MHHIKRTAASVLAIALLLGTHSAEARSPHRALASWYRCERTYYPGNVKTRLLTCRRHDLMRAPRAALGYWHHCGRFETAHTQVCVTWPRFRFHRIVQNAAALPSHTSQGCYRVTGYYPGGITADGSAAVPGVVASNIVPFGTRVSVPALGISGVVHDRIGYGSDFDFVSSNPFALTGCYQVIVG